MSQDHRGRHGRIEDRSGKAKSLYSIVFQDVTLFDNSIFENIHIGCTFENCTVNITVNGEVLPEIDVPDCMYENADQ